MKNIHVLPTDKPSRLYIDNKGKYNLEIGQVDFKTFQNIYITSDEEIKVGDYRYSLLQNNFELVSEFSLKVNKEYWKLNNQIYKKIILTTDQNLIKYGVQSIDDDFLEWFVKNPSCEGVEVIEVIYEPKNYIDIKKGWEYLIIIPKEEPKQGTIKQSVVEWQHDELMRINFEYATQKITPRDFQEQTKKTLEQAKEMEEERRGCNEVDMLNIIQKFGFDYTYNYRGEKTIYEWIPEWFEEYKRLNKQFKKKIRL